MLSEQEKDAFFAIIVHIMRNIHANTFAVRDELEEAAIARNALNEWMQFRQIFH